MADPTTMNFEFSAATRDLRPETQDGSVELEGVAERHRLAPSGRGATSERGAARATSWSAGVYRRVGAKPRVVSLGAWTGLLIAIDGSMAMAAAVIGSALRFGDTRADLIHGVPYVALAAALPFVWIGAMLLGRSCDRRYLAAGAEQFGRVANSAIWVLGLVAFVSFVLRADVSRGFVAIVIPLATCLTLFGRWGARAILRRRFRLGAAIHRVIVVGGMAEADQLAKYAARNSHTGFAVVGSFAVEAQSADLHIDVDRLVDDVRRVGADTIAFVATGRSRAGELRRLSWALHGSGIGLLVVPDLADIAGPRIEVNPVEGLPLLEICEPELTGPGRLLKSMFDRAVSLLLICLASPLLLAIAVAVRLSDGGPIFYRQNRIGKAGREFRIWKFRTMRVGASQRFGTVETEVGTVRVLHKERSDDRITKVGRILRRFSLDELPQLFNVLVGSMSLVGPRPLVPDEVDSFGLGSQVRLLVAPGMTGLWQVSGRSELPWEERIHLDLYYIENWSLWLDFSLLWRTFRVMVQSKGAC